MKRAEQEGTAKFGDCRGRQERLVRVSAVVRLTSERSFKPLPHQRLDVVNDEAVDEIKEGSGRWASGGARWE